MSTPGIPTPAGDEQRRTILAFIIQYKREHGGNSPTLGEIAVACFTVKSAVHYHLNVMAAAGTVVIGEYGASRNIEVPGGRWVYEEPAGG